MSEPLSETRKLSAIMFTDIHGYSRMMQIDEAETIKLLEEHNNLLFPIIESNGGTVIKTVGDAILSVFESCISSVDAAISIQEALSERANQKNAKILRVRIGVHLGEIVYKDGDVFGNGVNIAARLQPLADPGGICFSQAVYDQISSHYGARITRVGPLNLKNISEPQVVFRMQIEGFEHVEPTDNLTFNTAFAEGTRERKKKFIPSNKSHTIKALFSNVIKENEWDVSEELFVKIKFGEVVLDFSCVDLSGRFIQIEVGVYFGELRIIHAPAQQVVAEVEVVMGEVKQAGRTKDASGGVIRISGKVACGAVVIKQE